MLNIFSKAWRLYSFICAVLCTIVILYMCLLLVHYRYRYVELPGGIRLENSAWWFEKNYLVALKDSDGNVLVEPDVISIVWNEQYIKGYRYIPDANDIAFIYKIGADSAIEYSQITKEQYDTLANTSGLNSLKRNQYKGFLDLIKDKKYRRKWYE